MTGQGPGKKKTKRRGTEVSLFPTVDLTQIGAGVRVVF
jgi:hypothetical protein